MSTKERNKETETTETTEKKAKKNPFRVDDGVNPFAEKTDVMKENSFNMDDGQNAFTANGAEAAEEYNLANNNYDAAEAYAEANGQR